MGVRALMGRPPAKTGVLAGAKFSPFIQYEARVDSTYLSTTAVVLVVLFKIVGDAMGDAVFMTQSTRTKFLKYLLVPGQYQMLVLRDGTSKQVKNTKNTVYSVAPNALVWARERCG